MLAKYGSGIIEICDICGKPVTSGHAYSEGINRFCSFGCLERVNDMRKLAEEWTGLEDDGLGPDSYIEAAREYVYMETGHDLCEDEGSPPATDSGYPVPELIDEAGYALLGETADCEDVRIFMLVPEANAAREWRARIYMHGRLLKEVIWPETYSRSFRDEMAEAIRAALAA